jgi:DNA-binding transcriptional MerR regulator
VWYTVNVNWQSSDSEHDLAIGEVGARVGLSARTIRYYEELGLLPGVRRKVAGRRVYGPDQLERLRFIERLKKLGLSLGEIKQLNALYAINGSTATMLAYLEGLLDSHLEKLDGRIAELIGLRDEMGSYREHVGSRIELLKTRAGAALKPHPSENQS